MACQQSPALADSSTHPAPAPAPAPARAYHVNLVAAFVDRLRADPTSDPHTGLAALTLLMQGDEDELDVEERALMKELASAVKESRPQS